jgi:hypothetical protein
MDPSRFDTLVKGLVSQSSRRAVLATIGRRPLTVGGAGVLAALLAGLNGETTVAGCKRKCRRKNNDSARRRCRKRCRNSNARSDPGAQLDPHWCGTKEKRCFDDDPVDPVCAVCWGQGQMENNYQRFLSCYRNKSFCGKRKQSCCVFCALWAGAEPDDCFCCS